MISTFLASLEKSFTNEKGKRQFQMDRLLLPQLCHNILLVKPFGPNAPFLYPLKTSETVKFSNFFRD